MGGAATIPIPVPGLVLLVGPSGAGKTTLARRLFKPTEVVSSDQCRALVSDSESNQAASADAFRLLREIVALRLGRGRLAVVDATNVEPYDRRPLLDLAAGAGVPAVAIVFDLPLEVCLKQNETRLERRVAAAVVRRQWEAMLLNLPGLPAETGLAAVHLLRTPGEAAAAEVGRRRGSKLRPS